MSLFVSLVVVAYNMARELPRTIHSLSPPMQRYIEGGDYEVIVIDNGSQPPVRLEGHDSTVTVIQMENPRPSPAAAVNRGISSASGDVIGVLVDGARMASPGLIWYARMAAGLHSRPVIATVGFHLGPTIQKKSILEGYDRRREDELLEASGWIGDGYRLFAISALAGSAARGWFMPMSESNALFLTRELWEELGGYDEAFTSPGGGFVNLDTYVRSCALPDTEHFVLLGEGTFHQVHGGIATNAIDSPWEAFHDEYVRIRGKQFQPPATDPIFIGRVNSHVLPILEMSARRAMDQDS